jgi:hypothetical protein
MLISPDSPLRLLPVGLDRRQQIALDGVRVAADVLDLATTRLTSTLAEVVALDPHSDPYLRAAVSAISDAWSIVDNTHRFCELLKQFPRIKQRLPQFQVLYRSAAAAEPMRHFIQHVRNEIDALAQGGLSVWGTITWNLKSEFDAGQRIQHSLHIGTFYDGNFAAMGQFAKKVESEVDNITLHAGGHTMILSGLMRRVEEVIRGFELGIADQAGNLPRHSSDMLFALTMTPAASNHERPHPRTDEDA